MRTATIVISLVVLTACPVLAQSGGHIGLYSDSPGYSDCNLTAQLYTPNNVYVVHTVFVEATYARFRVVNYWGALFGGTSYHSNVDLGDIFSGVSVSYVGCKPLPHLLATLTFIPFTPTPPCVALEVAADPAAVSGQIEVVDCTNNVLIATGGALCVNHPTCCVLAEVRATLEACGSVETESSTWGGIKALYQ